MTKLKFLWDIEDVLYVIHRIYIYTHTHTQNGKPCMFVAVQLTLKSKIE